jgi:hypothetical protein
VLVVLLIATVAVLGGVFFAATGRGGEMAAEHPDHAPFDLGPVSAPDIALLRPPMALWGYNMQVTSEVLDHIARAMRDRDVTIAHLQQQLASRDAQGPSPQGMYDAHGWWAQQEEAEREEALRQARARAAAEAPSAEPQAAEPPSAEPQAAEHIEAPPADRHDSEPVRTSTQPNPTVPSPPDDEAMTMAEEQGW